MRKHDPSPESEKLRKLQLWLGFSLGTITIASLAVVAILRGVPFTYVLGISAVAALVATFTSR